jgi:hypothetical protein
MRRIRVVLALGALVGAVLAWQATASAALTVTEATLDGVTSTTTPPGGVLRARAEVQLTARSDWRGTRTRIGDQTTCADTGDHGSGRKDESFDVAAPGAPGSYDAAFSA